MLGIRGQELALQLVQNRLVANRQGLEAYLCRLHQRTPQELP
jgi:hypothetical protein